MSLPIQFPNVPNVPGVPQLARSVFAPPTPQPALGTGAAQGALWQASNGAPTWGVFDSAGKLAIDADSILNFDNRNEWRLSNYPIQNGEFASYNKVIVPFECSVRLAKGKTKTARKNFLAQIQTAAASLNVYTILTPERSYANVCITRYEVTRRDVKGAFFLTEVDVYFQVINQVQAQYQSNETATTDAQDPSAIPSVNGGQVQPQTPTPAVAQSAQAAVTQAIM